MPDHPPRRRPPPPRSLGMQPSISLRDALNDEALLGTVIQGSSWQAWRVMLLAMMGGHLTDTEKAIFKQLTGRRTYEAGRRVEEFAGVIGRRGGKSYAIACL